MSEQKQDNKAVEKTGANKDDAKEKEAKKDSKDSQSPSETNNDKAVKADDHNKATNKDQYESFGRVVQSLFKAVKTRRSDDDRDSSAASSSKTQSQKETVDNGTTKISAATKRKSNEQQALTKPQTETQVNKEFKRDTADVKRKQSLETTATNSATNSDKNSSQQEISESPTLHKDVLSIIDSLVEKEKTDKKKKESENKQKESETKKEVVPKSKEMKTPNNTKSDTSVQTIRSSKTSKESIDASKEDKSGTVIPCNEEDDKEVNMKGLSPSETKAMNKLRMFLPTEFRKQQRLNTVSLSRRTRLKVITFDRKYLISCSGIKQQILLFVYTIKMLVCGLVRNCPDYIFSYEPACPIAEAYLIIMFVGASVTLILMLCYTFHVVEALDKFNWLFAEYVFYSTLAALDLIFACFIFGYGGFYIVVGILGIYSSSVLLMLAFIKLYKYRRGDIAQPRRDDPDGNIARLHAPNIRFKGQHSKQVRMWTM